MDNDPAQTTVEDEIQPDDSASNVTGATHTSTMWVKAAQERAAAESNVQYLQQKLILEQTLAELMMRKQMLAYGKLSLNLTKINIVRLLLPNKLVRNKS